MATSFNGGRDKWILTHNLTKTVTIPVWNTSDIPRGWMCQLVNTANLPVVFGENRSKMRGKRMKTMESEDH